MLFIINNIISTNQYIYNHKKEFNNEIGEKIREIRLLKNMSTTELAENSLMSNSHLNQIENGINGITLNKFIIICNSLQIKPNDILEEYITIGEENDIFNNLQEGKNLSKNILEYLKTK